MNGVHFMHRTDQWETPQWLFDELDREFGFTVDVCADAQNAKCPVFYDREQDGLAQTWEGVCWCNPPYGREIARWVEKAAGGELHGGDADSRPDGHRLVSRPHLRKGGGPLHPGAAALQRCSGKCTVPQHDRCVSGAGDGIGPPQSAPPQSGKLTAPPCFRTGEPRREMAANCKMPSGEKGRRAIWRVRESVDSVQWIVKAVGNYQLSTINCQLTERGVSGGGDEAGEG